VRARSATQSPADRVSSSPPISGSGDPAALSVGVPGPVSLLATGGSRMSATGADIGLGAEAAVSPVRRRLTGLRSAPVGVAPRRLAGTQTPPPFDVGLVARFAGRSANTAVELVLSSDGRRILIGDQLTSAAASHPAGHQQSPRPAPHRKGPDLTRFRSALPRIGGQSDRVVIRTPRRRRAAVPPADPATDRSPAGGVSSSSISPMRIARWRSWRTFDVRSRRSRAHGSCRRRLIPCPGPSRAAGRRSSG
jgi:hypothetical protein